MLAEMACRHVRLLGGRAGMIADAIFGVRSQMSLFLGLGSGVNPSQREQPIVAILCSGGKRIRPFGHLTPQKKLFFNIDSTHMFFVCKGGTRRTKHRCCQSGHLLWCASYPTVHIHRLSSWLTLQNDRSVNLLQSVIHSHPMSCASLEQDM